MAITREERPKGTNHSSLDGAYLMKEVSCQTFTGSLVRVSKIPENYKKENHRNLWNIDFEKGLTPSKVLKF
jgi:hypothetical protein